jgi:anti-anti-sigma regulatory factor
MILSTVPAGPGLALFKIEGELDFAGAPTVQSALVRAADASRYGRMVIDLADIKTADEKGIASLASTVRKLLVQHPSMCIVAVARDRLLAGALSSAALPVYGKLPHSWTTVARPNKWCATRT